MANPFLNAAAVEVFTKRELKYLQFLLQKPEESCNKMNIILQGKMIQLQEAVTKYEKAQKQNLLQD